MKMIKIMILKEKDTDIVEHNDESQLDTQPDSELDTQLDTQPDSQLDTQPDSQLDTQVETVVEELHSQLNSNVDSGVDESEPQVDLELELSENGPTVIKLADKEEDTTDTEHFKVIQESDKLEELEENLNNIIDDSLKEIKLNQKKKVKDLCQMINQVIMK